MTYDLRVDPDGDWYLIQDRWQEKVKQYVSTY